jgi:ankyrin repeat protein
MTVLSTLPYDVQLIVCNLLGTNDLKNTKCVSKLFVNEKVCIQLIVNRAVNDLVQGFSLPPDKYKEYKKSDCIAPIKRSPLYRQIMSNFLEKLAGNTPHMKNRFYSYMSEKGHNEIIEKVSSTPSLSEEIDNIKAIQWAAAKGQEKTVQLLLHKAGVDPSIEDNYVLRWMVAQNKLDTVISLLKDKRVDPSAGDNYAIRQAAKKNYITILELLLNHPRVDPTAKNNESVFTAAQEGYIEIFNLLMADSRVCSSLTLLEKISLKKQILLHKCKKYFFNR